MSYHLGMIELILLALVIALVWLVLSRPKGSPAVTAPPIRDLPEYVRRGAVFVLAPNYQWMQDWARLTEKVSVREFRDRYKYINHFKVLAGIRPVEDDRVVILNWDRIGRHREEMVYDIMSRGYREYEDEAGDRWPLRDLIL